MNKEIIDKLMEIKKLYEDGILTKEEMGSPDIVRGKPYPNINETR